MSERNAVIEECARIAESAFARVPTYASENSDRYIAMRDAGNALAARIRTLATPEQNKGGEKPEPAATQSAGDAGAQQNGKR